MPPVRRYLRITKYSVLECRIYLDNPADVQRWLLNARDPVLPRVIEAVRPYVLPKLREENMRAKSGKGGKRKGMKDVVAEGIRSNDFEVAIFLTETKSVHAILKKEKRAKSEKPRLGTTERRMTGLGTEDTPLEVGDKDDVALVREESPDDTGIHMDEIPVAGEESGNDSQRLQHDDEGSLFVSDGSDDERTTGGSRRTRVIKEESVALGPPAGEDDKKKMALDTTYDGFTIYGRILCLVVKRRGTARATELAGGAGQAMMEEWISSTQAAECQIMDD
ncbi:MAG: hypothetical protein Q9195_005154 [Heterodermia aff. obscurata]